MQQFEGTCQYNNEEIRKAFPEYLYGDQNDIDIIEQAIQNYVQLISNYFEEKSIMEMIERKTIIAIHSSPSQLVIKNYSELLLQYFPCSILDQFSRSSRFFTCEEVPQLQQLYSFEEEEKEKKTKFPIPWVIIQDKTNIAELKSALVKIYNFNYGRVANHEQLFMWFPDMLCSYWKVIEKLMVDEGLLPIDWRYYIAIMAVSIFGCEQLYYLLVNQFLSVEGDRDWIEIGLEALPPKLKSLNQITIMLATVPWESALEEQLVLLLQKWHRNELLHALCIFSLYNCLACFSMGFGVIPEKDLNNTSLSSNSSFLIAGYTPRKLSGDEFQNKEVVNVLRQIGETKTSVDAEDDNKFEVSPKGDLQILEFSASEEPIQDESQSCQKFEKIFSEKFLRYTGCFIDYGDINHPQFESQNVSSSNNLTNYTLQSSSSDLKQSSQKYQYKGLLSSTFSFTTNGYPFLRDIMGDSATKIFDFIQCVKYMTNENFYKEKTSTSPFRNAIRLYVENINRYHHEGLDYKDQMNKLIKRELKLYVKLIVQNPSRITKSTIDSIPYKLNADEICHIALLAIIAKLEMQFVYLTKSLSQVLK